MVGKPKRLGNYASNTISSQGKLLSGKEQETGKEGGRTGEVHVSENRSNRSCPRGTLGGVKTTSSKGKRKVTAPAMSSTKDETGREHGREYGQGGRAGTGTAAEANTRTKTAKRRGKGREQKEVEEIERKQQEDNKRMMREFGIPLHRLQVCLRVYMTTHSYAIHI